MNPFRIFSTAVLRNGRVEIKDSRRGSKERNPLYMPFQQHVLSEQIALDPHISQLLTDLKEPDVIDAQWLMQLGKDALEEKKTSIELMNAGLNAREKQRIPTSLSFSDVAVILSYVFPWRSIEIAAGDTILGCYLNDDDHKGLYIVDVKELGKIVDSVAPTYNTRTITDVLEKIERIAPTVQQTSDPNLTIVNNGIYDRTERKLIPFSPDYVFTSKIATDFVADPKPVLLTAPDGYVWDVDTWISELAEDEDTQTLLWQVIADFIQSGITRNKSIWFYSQAGNNGKGTFGQLIKNLVGRQNYASLSVEQFSHEFYKANLIGVVGVIGDENNTDKYIDSVPDFKAAVSGDDLMINRKYAAPINYQFKGSIIQMINALPKTKDKTDSFYRRLILVPFLKSFTNNGERTYIKNEYIYNQKVLEYVLHKALVLPDFTEFIVPEKSKEALSEYKELNNPVIQFWNELSDSFEWDLLPTQFLYDLFVAWYKRNNPNGKVSNKKSFSDSLSLYLENNTEWKPSFQTAQRSVGRMDSDEELISTYRLIDWTDTSYTGTSLTRMRKFNRAVSYRGVLRRT